MAVPGFRNGAEPTSADLNVERAAERHKDRSDAERWNESYRLVNVERAAERWKEGYRLTNVERAAERHEARSDAERWNEGFRSWWVYSEIGKLIPVCFHHQLYCPDRFRTRRIMTVAC